MLKTIKGRLTASMIGIVVASILLTTVGIIAVAGKRTVQDQTQALQLNADKYAEEVNLKKIEMMNILGVLMWGLSRAVPVFICLILGSKVVTSFVSYFPVWLSSGLKVAGGLLPAVGIAILLRYLPTKKYIPYLLMGFVLAAYLGVPMLGVAICGLALALLFYRQGGFNEAKAETGGMDDDE